MIIDGGTVNVGLRLNRGNGGGGLLRWWRRERKKRRFELEIEICVRRERSGCCVEEEEE